MAFALASSRTGLRGVATRASRSRVACKVVARQSWLPGSELPAHLTGSLPADFGFDPLGLGKDAEALKWYTAAEVFHCRLAMAGVAGVLIPALLTKAGALNVPQWYDAGKVYDAQPDHIPFSALLMVELFLCGFVESKRWMEIMKPGSQAEKGSFLGFEGAFAGTGNPAYPGGPFDPMGFSKSSSFAEYQVKEIKNGRLAMMAALGFAAQYGATGKGPIDNLAEHLADPWHKTFVENGVSVPFL